jgi:hypothetical protein
LQRTRIHLIVLIAAGIALGAAYFAGGARGLGSGERDLVFSPAIDPEVQLQAPELQVPLGATPTLSALAARGSLAIALGRRSAIRDFAAVSAATAAVVFALAVIAAGFAPAVAIVSMMGMGFGASFWWRGTTYTPDALFPLLVFTAMWTALHFQQTRRRGIAVACGVCAVLAIVDVVTPMTGVELRTPTTPGFISSLIREFTPLGLFLAAIGLLLLLSARATRAQALGVATGALLFHWVARSEFEPVHVVLVIGGWWSIAVALWWLHSVLPERSRLLVLGAVATVLIATPALTRARAHSLGADVSSERRARAASDLPGSAESHGIVVIAESRRADAALLLSSRVLRRPISIIPQSVDAVAAAITAGTPAVIAFENAGANLERLGFLFEPAVLGSHTVAAVVGRVPCAPLADDRWSDVSLLAANGSLIIHGAPNTPPAGVVVRMASDSPVRVGYIEPRRVEFEIGDVTKDAEGVSDLLTAARRAPPAVISSLRVPAAGVVGPIIITFASAPTFAVATSEDPISTSVCPGVHRPGLMLGSAATATASVSMNDNAPFGSGWHPVEADPDFFRWTAAPESAFRVSIARPGAIRVTVTATPASRAAQQPTIALGVNECRLPSQSMQAGQGDYEWLVEERCWRSGANQLWLATSPLISPASLFATHDKRLLGARIGAIRLARMP